MSGYTFRLSAAPEERLDVSQLTPGKLAAMSASDIARIAIGASTRKLTVGDAFAITGKPGDTVVFAGGSGRLDFVGAELDQGTVIVEGDAGFCAGRSMRGGRLEIRGDAGTWLASGLAGGLVSVKGSVGAFTGAPRPGDNYGMSGGTVIIEGDAGDRTGERLKSGTIVIRGRCGANAGARMLGGTVWAEQGFGALPGILMRRGTLMGPSVERMLPTFVDTGKHDLVIMRIFSRYLSATLGPLAPRQLTGGFRRYAGDLATIGKGEILITG